MPLNTQILRDDQPRTIRWGEFHVAAMVVAAALDSGEGPWDDNTRAGILGEDAEPGNPIGITPRDAFTLASYPYIGATPLGHDPYVINGGPYKFVDRADGEEFDILPGDKLLAWRD